MANIISVRIDIEGCFDQLVKIKDYARTHDQEFSFEKINPMPEEIKKARELGDLSDEYRKYVIWFNANWSCDQPNFIISRLNNTQRLSYSFDTRGSAPVSVIKKLSALFPETIIVMFIEDELDRMSAMDEAHRGLYEIPANIFCNGQRIQAFTHTKILYSELIELANDKDMQK